MKRLFTCCYFFMCTFAAQAQQKPTQEATLAFMNRVLNEAKGVAVDKGTSNEHRYLDVTLRKDYYHSQTAIPGSDYTNNVYIEGIPWDTFDGFGRSTEIGNCTDIFVRFKATLRVSMKRGDTQSWDSFYINGLDFIVLTEKTDSFRKACLRLAETVTEENKDPFKD
ncbi:hypothetical protein GO988_00940 [Hymenobacter sp. HMF4947]|uniref:DUF4468 domain-containing protein n=1 Tax=Hymenobacter ginkgonis TaxID=2682976 RepID=A0A7K1T904_9BACT|nr:hypothetical protein [Hymenobacter ginkgonis]MVN74884.1 hypothetical protein [Hymenobacter ginkgonis]